MAENSKIEWTEATWNPIAGCSVKSPGCTNCYAMRRVAPRLAKNPAIPHYHDTVKKAANGQYVWTGKIGIADDKVFLKPMTWRKPLESDEDWERLPHADCATHDIRLDKNFGLIGKERAGRLLDGVEHNAMPQVRP